MAREQVLQTIKILNIDDNAISITNQKQLVTSFIIQNPIENTEFLLVGNNQNQHFEIAPGNDLAFDGDKLDHGTQAYCNLNHWFIRSKTAVQISCNVLILRGY